MDSCVLIHSGNIENALNQLMVSDYYSDIDENDNKQYKILNILCLTYKENNNWNISYYIEIPDMEKIVQFEDEYFSLITYIFLKEKYTATPIIDIDKSWPYTTISHTICVDGLTFYQLSQLISDTRNLLNFYLSLHLSRFNSNNCDEINEIAENLLQKISIQELYSLSATFEYLVYLKKLISFGFSPTGVFRPDSMLKFVSDDNAKVEYHLYFTEYYNDSGDYNSATVLLNLQRYLVLVSNDIIYIVYNNAYNFLNELGDLFANSFHDSSNIKLQITQQHLLVLSNSIFTITQPAYVLDERYKKVLIDEEIKKIKNRFQCIIKCKYFNVTTIINEFEQLIDNSSTTEEMLESFLSTNYKAIFGREYDLIKTQVRLCVDKTIDTKDRRFDILLHNSITNDWEVFELKKASEKIIRFNRGIPQFRAPVISAISQLRHYRDLLMLTETKKLLKQKLNIVYSVPKFYLIVGNDMSDASRKCMDQEKDIVIKTYKTLCLEAEKNYNYL